MNNSKIMIKDCHQFVIADGTSVEELIDWLSPLDKNLTFSVERNIDGYDTCTELYIPFMRLETDIELQIRLKNEETKKLWKNVENKKEIIELKKLAKKHNFALQKIS